MTQLDHAELLRQISALRAVVEEQVVLMGRVRALLMAELERCEREIAALACRTDKVLH